MTTSDNMNHDERVSRRELLRRGAVGAAGMIAAGSLGTRAGAAPADETPQQQAADEKTARDQAAQAKAKKGQTKSVIQIFLWGGMSHNDAWDPKPGTGYDYLGELDKFIPTNVDGIQLGALFPMLATQADKFSLIRSMTHGNNGHETAAYLVQTGRTSERDVFPGLGAVVSYFKGYEAGYSGLVPPYVVLTQPQGRFSEAGFLGPRYKPFATGGDPNAKVFAVEGIVAYGEGSLQVRALQDYFAA